MSTNEDLQMNEPYANGQSEIAMPEYHCRKRTFALKIDLIEYTHHEDDTLTATITPAEEGYVPFVVDESYLNKHKPEAGGYYVVYSQDGYKSFSPADVFEAGYARIL